MVSHVRVRSAYQLRPSWQRHADRPVTQAATLGEDIRKDHDVPSVVERSRGHEQDEALQCAGDVGEVATGLVSTGGFNTKIITSHAESAQDGGVGEIERVRPHCDLDRNEIIDVRGDFATRLGVTPCACWYFSYSARAAAWVSAK